MARHHDEIGIYYQACEEDQFWKIQLGIICADQVARGPMHPWDTAPEEVPRIVTRVAEHKVLTRHYNQDHFEEAAEDFGSHSEECLMRLRRRLSE